MGNQYHPYEQQYYQTEQPQIKQEEEKEEEEIKTYYFEFKRLGEKRLTFKEKTERFYYENSKGNTIVLPEEKTYYYKFAKLGEKEITIGPRGGLSYVNSKG